MAPPVIHLYGPPLAPPVELSRWMLERLGIPYEFSPAAAGLSALRSWKCNVPIELPLLKVDGVPYSIAKCFALVERRMGGRAFMGGDAPSDEDVLFAALSSSVLLPPGHPVKLPPLDTMPAELRQMVARLRDTVAGRLAIRTYAVARHERLAERMRLSPMT